MMREDELTIGDWVMDKDGHKVQLNFDMLCNDIDFDEIYPIPITDDILYDNGFEYVHRSNAQYKDTEFYITCHTNYSYTDDPEYSMYNRLGIWYVMGLSELPISYVHELQHALKLGKLVKVANRLIIK